MICEENFRKVNAKNVELFRNLPSWQFFVLLIHSELALIQSP